MFRVLSNIRWMFQSSKLVTLGLRSTISQPMDRLRLHTTSKLIGAILSRSHTTSLQSRNHGHPRAARRFSNHEAGWQMEKCLRRGDWVTKECDECWMGYRWLRMSWRFPEDLVVFFCGFPMFPAFWRSFSRCGCGWSARPRGGLCFEGADATSAARLLSWPGGNQKVLTPVIAMQGDRRKPPN